MRPVGENIRSNQVILATLHNVAHFDDDDDVIADDDFEEELPSPQGLGPQWEFGASGKFESVVCPPSLAEGSLAFLKAEDSLAFFKVGGALVLFQVES